MKIYKTINEMNLESKKCQELLKDYPVNNDMEVMAVKVMGYLLLWLCQEPTTDNSRYDTLTGSSLDANVKFAHMSIGSSDVMSSPNNSFVVMSRSFNSNIVFSSFKSLN